MRFQRVVVVLFLLCHCCLWIFFFAASLLTRSLVFPAISFLVLFFVSSSSCSSSSLTLVQEAIHRYRSPWDEYQWTRSIDRSSTVFVYISTPCLLFFFLPSFLSSSTAVSYDRSQDCTPPPTPPKPTPHFLLSS